MREWVFKSYRPVDPAERFPIFARFPIRPASGAFIGSAQDALSFARRACEHLSAKGVERVEAWTQGQSEPLPGSITSRIRPHENGKDWRVLEDQLQHPLWTKDLGHGINHMLFRGLGKLCRIEVLNKAGAVQWTLLLDQSDRDPYQGSGPTWKGPAPCEAGH